MSWVPDSSDYIDASEGAETSTTGHNGNHVETSSSNDTGANGDILIDQGQQGTKKSLEVDVTIIQNTKQKSTGKNKKKNQKPMKPYEVWSEHYKDQIPQVTANHSLSKRKTTRSGCFPTV